MAQPQSPAGEGGLELGRRLMPGLQCYPEKQTGLAGAGSGQAGRQKWTELRIIRPGSS